MPDKQMNTKSHTAYDMRNKLDFQMNEWAYLCHYLCPHIKCYKHATQNR